MAGKSYYKLNGSWVKINKMFVKAGSWTNIQKAYVKVSGVWTKIFDSTSNAAVNNTTPKLRYKGYSDGTTNDPVSGYPNVATPIIVGPNTSVWGSGVSGDTNAGPEGGNKTYLWGWDGKWSNDTGATTYRYMMVNTSLDTNTWSYSGDATGTANTGPDTVTTYGDKLANTYNKIRYYDDYYIWYQVIKTVNNIPTVAICSNPSKIIKQNVVSNSFVIQNWQNIYVGTPVRVDFGAEYYWYNSPDLTKSYIEWFSVDSLSDPLTSSNRVRGPIYLDTKSYGSSADNYINTNGSSLTDYQNNISLTGSDLYTPQSSDYNKRLKARITLVNSYTTFPGNSNYQTTDYTAAVLDSPPVGSGEPTVTRSTDTYDLKITNLGTWTNSPTSYRYQWFKRVASPYGYYYTQLTDSSASGTFTQTQFNNNTHPSFDASPYKPSSNSVTLDNYYVRLWASNANGESIFGSSSGFWLDSIGGTYEIKGSISSASVNIKYKEPSISSFTVTGGSGKATISYTVVADDPSATVSVSWSGAATGSQNLSGLSQTSYDIPLTTGGTYSFTLTVSNAGTNAVTSSKTSTVSNISVTGIATYTYSMGNTLHISTNGYISFDAAKYNTTPSVASQDGNRILAIWPADLMQGPTYNSTSPTTSLLWWSNTTDWLYEWRGYAYNTGTADINKYLQFQVRFYNGQQYADVLYTSVGSTLTKTSNPGMYVNGSVLNSTYSGTITSGTIIRYYFDGSTPQQIFTSPVVPFGALVYSNGLTGGTYSPPQADDSYTTTVTSANQYDKPTATTFSNYSTNTSSAIYLQFYGGKDYNGYSYQVRTSSYTGTLITSGSATTNASPTQFSITSGLNADTQYYITLTPKNSFGQLGDPVNISTTLTKTLASVPVQITAPKVGSSTSNYASGGYIDVKYPNSVYWVGGTYSSAASVTSVLMYSTAPANFSSPTSDTTTNYRTANPYALASGDGTGSPYYFAVRDTVVGNNGITYYYYSYSNSYVRSQPGDALTPTLSASTSQDGGFYFDVNNYDSNYTWSTSIDTTPGTVSAVGTSSPYRVTVSGLGSNVTRTVTVSTSRTGYNNGTATRSGVSNTVTTYTLTYSANGGSTTPTAQTGANGATVTLAANAGTRSGFSFGGWDIGGTTYAGGASYTFGSANATATAIWTAVFVAPAWNGTLPGWTAGSNFQRITTSPANYKWGWTNGTFSFSGSVDTSANKGWNFNGPNSTQLSAGTARTVSLYKSYATTNDTYTSVQGTFRPYLVSSARGDVTYATAARYGSIQAFVFGTDGNEYNSPWTAGI
jgi:hypothetical protein